MADEESQLDDLYAAPLDQFVKVRNEIAARLKKDGDDEAAARVAALKKPSVSAWTVNQLARSGSLDLQRLIKAGEALERAQSRAMSGEDSSGFEEARRDEAAAISLLRNAAREVLGAPSPAVLDRIVSTLRAGVPTPEGRTLLKLGRLTEDLEPTGFGSFAGLTVSTSPKEPGPRPSAVGKRQVKIDSLRKRLLKADADARTREADTNALELEAEAAEAIASQARKVAGTARKRAEAAAADARRIREELAELEKDH
ncbi:MAG TPA: hypothetical protein VJQ79_00300 [Acidimicrobiia bacterium]|nr:hypothetical protein [Acidimicrobiia bacterium]